MAQFKVMSWNVENLFDVGDEDGPDTQAELKAKIESLRSVIDEQKPHVLGCRRSAPRRRSAGCRRRSRRRCRTGGRGAG